MIEFTKKGDNYATLVDNLVASGSVNGEKKKTSYVNKYYPEMFKAFEGFNQLLFSKELLFYKEIVEKVQKQLDDIGVPKILSPKCSFATKENGGIIFLEDMRERYLGRSFSHYFRAA